MKLGDSSLPLVAQNDKREFKAHSVCYSQNEKKPEKTLVFA